MEDGKKADVTNPAQPPFGNGDGATSSAGPSEGGHDFVEDGKSPAPATGGGIDVAKQNRPQRMGEPDYDKDSVPEGGRLPFGSIDAHRFTGTAGGFPQDAPQEAGTKVGEASGKPFKI